MSHFHALIIWYSGNVSNKASLFGFNSMVSNVSVSVPCLWILHHCLNLQLQLLLFRSLRDRHLWGFCWFVGLFCFVFVLLFLVCPWVSEFGCHLLSMYLPLSTQQGAFKMLWLVQHDSPGSQYKLPSKNINGISSMQTSKYTARYNTYRMHSFSITARKYSIRQQLIISQS